MASRQGKAIAQFLGMCLKGTKDKEKFEFFNFETDIWDKLVPYLNVILPGTEIHQDAPTVVAFFNAWKTEIAQISNQKRNELNLAARTPPAGVTFSQDGRKAWYNKMKHVIKMSQRHASLTSQRPWCLTSQTLGFRLGA